MTLETIHEVEKEVERFSKRLQEAKTRIQGDNYYPYSGCKETGALKRGALDLKNELTKLTKTPE
jgi:hypothetical protein